MRTPVSLRTDKSSGDAGSSDELRRESIESWERRVSSKYAPELTRLSALPDYKVTLGLGNLFNQVLEDPAVPFSPRESEEIMTMLTLKIPNEPKEILEKFKGGCWYDNFHSYTNQSRQAPHHDAAANEVKHKHLLKHWTDEYMGSALDALWERLRLDQIWRNGPTDQCKCIDISQSSGVGKTRLLHELGRRMLGITFMLKMETEPGFPSQDAAIYNYIVLVKELAERNAQAKALGLVTGTLATFSKYIMQAVADKKTFPQFLQGWGILTDHPGYSGFPHSHSVNASGIPKTLPARRNILEQIVQEAEKAEKLVYEDMDLEMKNSLEASDFRDTAQPEFKPWYTTAGMRNILLDKLQEANDLLKALPGIESDTMSSSMMFIAFDESADLTRFKVQAGNEPSRERELYSALRRVYTITKDFPLWGFFSSTNSRFDVFGSAAAADGSSRLIPALECRREPFLSFPLNLENNRLLTSPDTRDAELRAPISSFSEASHMAKFGRPLWQVYKELKYEDLIREVKVKMFGEGTFNVSDCLHVFAVCASRICLDPGINDSATTLAQGAVSANLRIVTRLEPRTGLIRTITPSEPLVAEAAASVLMSSTSLVHGTVKTTTWEPCLQFLTNHLLRYGLVDKGTCGEILARVILLLARDMLFSHRVTKSCQMRFSQPFTVRNFLTSLLGKDSAKLVFDAGISAPTRVESGHRGSYPKKALDIGDGWMNFSHFTSVNTDLQKHMLPDLLYHLFRQNAALQLSFKQPYYNILLPVYMGDINQPINFTKLTGIMVQVKNRITPEAVKFCPKIHELIPNPKLYLQVELGYEKAVPEDRELVEAWLETDKKQPEGDEITPAVIVAVAYGLYQTTFPFMKEGMLENTCRELLRELSSEGRVQDTKEAVILEGLESYRWPLGLLNSASGESANSDGV